MDLVVCNEKKIIEQDEIKTSILSLSIKSQAFIVMVLFFLEKRRTVRTVVLCDVKTVQVLLRGED